MTEPFRILVAEDDPNDAFFLERALSRAGVDVPIRFVDDGQQAIDFLEEEAPFAERGSGKLPTLLLLDLKMPRMDGFEVLQWIRKRPDLKNMIVVVLSASGLDEDKDRAQALGANGYIVKPSQPADLLTFAQGLKAYWAELNSDAKAADKSRMARTE